MFPVKKQKVIECCENILEQIYYDRRAKRKDSIEKEMNKFFFPAKTEEEAEARYVGRFCSLPEWDYLYGRDERRAQSIMNACLVADSDIVNLSREDAAFIAPWQDDQD